MRYQDWDILLFPSGDHVPVQEFKTACYAVRDNAPGVMGSANGGDVMPLLTSFIPSLPSGSPFAISVHSWGQQTPAPNSELDLSALRLEWQVKVIVDGYTICREYLPADTAWPKVISPSAEDTAVGEIRCKLCFPPFDPAVLSQHRWSPTDGTGRIKIEIQGGFSRERSGVMEFQKLANIASFAFQPAPIEHLERNRIAWPNPSMFANPLSAQGPLQPTPAQHYPTPTGERSSFGMHDRKNSWSSMIPSSPMGAMPGPPPSTPVDSVDLRGFRTLPEYAHRFGGRDMSSSTSSSSSYPTIAFGGVHSNHHTYPSALATGIPKQPLEFRLPSDQIRQIIDGLGGSRGNGLQGEIQRMQTLQEDASRMPPPPAPAFSRQMKDSQPYTPFDDAQFGPYLHEGEVNRRGMSRSSDVSMHAGCADYPHCIHEDAEGKLWHDTPSTPATVVRGKKEGIAPATARTDSMMGPFHRPSYTANIVTARDYLSNITPDHASTTQQLQSLTASSPANTDNKDVTVLSSSSPVVTTANVETSSSASRKRTRSARRSTTANNGGSPSEKTDATGGTAKPRRKSSRKASAANIKSTTTTTTTAASAAPAQDKDTSMEGTEEAVSASGDGVAKLGEDQDQGQFGASVGDGGGDGIAEAA